MGPTVVQGFIYEVFWEYLHRFVLAYIEDILVYSRNLAEHLHHVSEALKKLQVLPESREIYLSSDNYPALVLPY